MKRHGEAVIPIKVEILKIVLDVAIGVVVVALVKTVVRHPIPLVAAAVPGGAASPPIGNPSHDAHPAQIGGGKLKRGAIGDLVPAHLSPMVRWPATVVRPQARQVRILSG